MINISTVLEKLPSEKEIEAAFDTVGLAMVSTGDTLVGLYDAFTGLDKSGQLKLWNEIDKESTRRERSLEMQEKLTTAQIKYMDARTDAMARGESLITIESSGLEPHLEAFMWAVIEKVQM